MAGVVYSQSAPSAQHSGYFSPVFRLTKVNDQTGFIAGGRGMWVINSHFAVGGGFYGLMNSPNAPMKTPDKEVYKTNLTYGGLEFEYIAYPFRKTYFTLSILFAGAGIKVNPYYGGDFMILEPMVNVGYLIGEFSTVKIGVSYRNLSQYTIYQNIPKNGIEGVSTNIAFTFGKFW